MKINTEVLELYRDYITCEDFNLHVKERVNFILDSTKDKYFTYKSMMMWVAEQTKSVVYCDETNHEYSFSYVGI